MGVGVDVAGKDVGLVIAVGDGGEIGVVVGGGAGNIELTDGAGVGAGVVTGTIWDGRGVSLGTGVFPPGWQLTAPAAEIISIRARDTICDLITMTFAYCHYLTPTPDRLSIATAFGKVPFFG